MTDSCDDPCDDVTLGPTSLLGWVKREKKEVDDQKKNVDTLSLMAYNYDIR